MLKEEFNKLVSEKTGKVFEVSEYEYDTIEKVYSWHPSIDDVNGKEQVADLYVNFGYVIFLDMLSRAKVMENIEYERLNLDSKLKELQAQKAIANFNPLVEVNEILRDF